MFMSAAENKKLNQIKPPNIQWLVAIVNVSHQNGTEDEVTYAREL